jgi:hypothetical protein
MGAIDKFRAVFGAMDMRGQPHDKTFDTVLAGGP